MITENRDIGGLNSPRLEGLGGKSRKTPPEVAWGGPDGYYVSRNQGSSGGSANMMRQSILSGAVVVVLSAGAVQATEINMDLAKRQAAICTSCHYFGENEGHKVGPNLYGIIGRPAGSKADFAYSEDMKKQKFKWDAERIDKWITAPKAMLPGTKMSYPGMDKPEIRKNIIAWVVSVTTPPKTKK